MAIRYLGVDVGSKRIGLAVGDAGGVVSPLKIVPAGGSHEADARVILEVAEEYGADEIVVGWPLNMDGSEGPQAQFCRGLAETLERKLGIGKSDECSRVHLHDERLTSHAADQRLAERELTRDQKKARQDAIAAQIILLSFLESRET